MNLVSVLLATAVAGAVGTLLRAEVLRRAGPPGSAARARAVAGVNLAGAAALGSVQLLGASDAVVIVLGVGFCGALTTFSTWVVEAWLRAESGVAWARIATFDLAAQLAAGTALVAVLGRLA